MSEQEKEINELTSAIKESADAHLLGRAHEVEFVAGQQGGVGESQENPAGEEVRKNVLSDLLGLSLLTAELRKHLLNQSSNQELTDAYVYFPEPKTIAHQSEFVQSLLGDYPKLLDDLAKTVAKTNIFLELLHEQHKVDDSTREVENRIVAWHRVLENVASTICGGDEGLLSQYQVLVQQSLESLSSSSQQEVVGRDGSTSIIERGYKNRLARVLRNPRSLSLLSTYASPEKGGELAGALIDEYLETAYALSVVKVLDRIERPLSVEEKLRKLLNHFKGLEADPKYLKMIEENNLEAGFSQEEIERLFNKYLGEDEETVDIIFIKSEILFIKDQAEKIKASDLNDEEKQKQLVDLDRRIKELMVDVANKVSRVFPHENSTNLAEVLENADAVCAGKVNVLLAVSKYIGLDSRTDFVAERMDGGFGEHVCYECDLPSGAVLIVDANYSNRPTLGNKTRSELIEYLQDSEQISSQTELASLLDYILRMLANSEIISKDSKVLMYSARRAKTITDGEVRQSGEKLSNPFVRINPQNGIEEIWEAEVPNPHPSVIPDKGDNSLINSSFINNNRFLLSLETIGGDYLFLKSLETSPYNPHSYENIINFSGMPVNEQLETFERAKLQSPDFYWREISMLHAMLCVLEDSFEEAFHILNLTKLNNPTLYYRELGKFYNRIKYKQDDDVGSTFVKQIQELMERESLSNPSEFYSNISNLLNLDSIYGDSGMVDKQIGAYQQFKRFCPIDFWSTSGSIQVFAKLSNIYLSEDIFSYEGLSSEAIEFFFNEVKQDNPSFYMKQVSFYVEKFFIRGNEEGNLEKAIDILEEAVSENADMFFSYDGNIDALLRVYKRSRSEEFRTQLLEKLLEHNHSNFWGVSSFRPYYIDLVDLYERGNRIAEAIEICLVAKSEDPQFFNPLWRDGGYTRLAELYVKGDQLDEAIEVFKKGELTDENYWGKRHRKPIAPKLADVYEQNNQIDEAIKVYEQLRDENNEFWMTRYYKVCRLYDLTNQPDKAKQIREELIDKYSELRDNDKSNYDLVASNLAELYISEGKIDEAIEVLENGRESNPYFPIGSIALLARLYAQSGRSEEAREAYEEAVKKYRLSGQKPVADEIIEQAKSNGIDI